MTCRHLVDPPSARRGRVQRCRGRSACGHIRFVSGCWHLLLCARGVRFGASDGRGESHFGEFVPRRR